MEMTVPAQSNYYYYNAYLLIYQLVFFLGTINNVQLASRNQGTGAVLTALFYS